MLALSRDTIRQKLTEANFAFSGILQTQVMKIYPAEVVVVFLYLLCATIISAPVCLIVEGNLSSWILRPDITLVAVIYSVRTTKHGQYQMTEQVIDNI